MMIQRFPLLITALVAAAFCIGIVDAHAQYPAAGAQSCDCSCDSFAEFQAAMQNQSAGQFTPEMQQVAACYPQCMQQWTQCAQQEQAATDRDSDRWDCDKRPNSPVERRKWREACGKPTGDAYWAERLGQARGDLDRFYGTYEGADLGWVAAPAEASMAMLESSGGKIPGGYMMLYATRGDVAPYYLNSVSDSKFTYTVFGGATKTAEFVLGNDGHATALILDGERYVRAAGSRESRRPGESTGRAANPPAAAGGDGTGPARCVFTDQACIEAAKQRGADITITDQQGNVLGGNQNDD
ncbi:MAG: hypothetical protein U5K76_03120 [Woeseiaceae bacterium]|nr:hypothetical protein [Woeseiaceae bacterium]